MKKVLTLFSGLLIFAGLKAQTPTVKKETVKPAVAKPVLPADSLKAIKSTGTRLPDKALKITTIKKTNTLPMKDMVAKPDKR
jgi:hypothetical protein